MTISHTLTFSYSVIRNKRGGQNTFGVEVRGTGSEVPSSLLIKKTLQEHLTFSNTPTLLLIVDVKRNALYYGWPSREDRNIQLNQPDDETTSKLRKQLVDWSN